MAHLSRETFAAHCHAYADDVARPLQECDVNDVAEGREAEVAGQLGCCDAIPLGYVLASILLSPSPFPAGPGSGSGKQIK